MLCIAFLQKKWEPLLAPKLVEARGVEPLSRFNYAIESTCLDAFAISLAKGLHGASTCVLEPAHFSQESEVTPMIVLQAYIVQLYSLFTSMLLMRSSIVFA